MALSKVDFNNINVTPAASKALKFNSNANGFETGDIDGSMVLLSTQTASSSANISFTSGIDDTYKEYVFKFIDIHPSVDAGNLEFNMSVDGGSNYNVAKTTTSFYGYQTESGSASALAYDGNLDLAQGTGFQKLLENVGTDNDQCGAGTLTIFNPSSDTFVKHFMFRGMRNGAYEYAVDYHIAGYGNTTSAVNAIQFKMHDGNIDSGTIKMYGIT